MTSVDDFDVAKTVADQLKGLDRDRQVRILRWVSESLGMAPTDERPNAAVYSPTSDVGRSAIPGGPTNIKSFIDYKDPKSDNQFAATVAYFYRFEAPQNERRETISPEKLQEAARLSGRKRLGDPGKTLRNAKDQGYLDIAARGEFKINSVGENLVAMTLPSQGAGRTANAPRKSGRVNKKKR